MPQPNVPPVSSVTIGAISGARSSSRSAAFSRILRRRPGALVRHSLNASAAASTAARASSRPAAAVTVAVSPVNGLAFSYVPPPFAAVQLPPISSCCS